MRWSPTQGQSEASPGINPPAPLTTATRRTKIVVLHRAASGSARVRQRTESAPTHRHGVGHDDRGREAALLHRRGDTGLESSEGERVSRRAPSSGEGHGSYGAPSRRQEGGGVLPPALKMHDRPTATRRDAAAAASAPPPD